MTLNGQPAAATDRPKRNEPPADPGDLADVLEQLRPWGDRRAVERALRDWASRHGLPTLAAGEASIAAELRRLGGPQNARPPDRDEAAGIVAGMLGNVAAGREATEYGLRPVARIASGVIPDRTMRRYRSEPGGPLVPSLRRIAHDAGVACLVAGGRSKVAARAWLRRNPGISPAEASPPRNGSAPLV